MDAKRLARVHAALGSELRLRIVELVSAHREMCVCELVVALRMSQANTSRHVGILRDAGVLRDRKLGTWVLLSVDEAALREASAELTEMVRRNHKASRSEDVEARLATRCDVAVA